MKKHLIFLFLFINSTLFGFSQGTSNNNEIAPKDLNINAIRNLLDEEDFFYKSALVDNSIILKLGNNMVTYDLTIELVENFLFFTSSIETSETISEQRLKRVVSIWNEEYQGFHININYKNDNNGKLNTSIENLYFYSCIGGINSDNLNSTITFINRFFEDLISDLKDEDAI